MPEASPSPLTLTSGPLGGRIALVTGASRGIGYASALGLARAGAHVIATARTQGGLEELDDAIVQATGERATLVPLDITNGAGLDQLGAAMFERWGRLDILLSNAGELGLLTPVGHLDPQVWERAVGVNMTATYRLIRSVDPLLRRAEAGRALFVTTNLQQTTRAFWASYAASKAGMEALVRGFTTAKYFPATAAGGLPGIKALAGPFPQARFCPTGGITEDNAPEWLAQPNVVAVGGSWLTPEAEIRAGNWDAIRDRAARTRAKLEPQA